METKIYMGIMFEFDESQCICELPCALDERGSVPITVLEKFLMSNPSFLVVIPCPEFSTYLRSFLRGIIRWTFKLTAYLHLVPSQRMCGGITPLHSNQLRYLLYCSTDTIWHASVPVYNSPRLSVSSGSDYTSKATMELYVPQVRLQSYQLRKA